MGRHLYELWAGPNDPPWFSLSNQEQERWERFARDVDDEYEAARSIDAEPFA